jgi:putative transposase
VKTVADALGVARSNLVEQAAAPPLTLPSANRRPNLGPAPPSQERRGRKPRPDSELLAEIKEIIAAMPTYGYRRVHALLRRRRGQDDGPAVNVKRVYRVMKAHGLLLQRHSGDGAERRHDGRVAVGRSDERWCSDGFEIGCDNGERVRIAFALDCCDREAISWVATTGAIDSGDIRDLMIDSIERRFGPADRLPDAVEWLTDNGSPYVARETRALARAIGLVPLTTPIESPQSNGMAEAFVKTFKRDYARVNARPDAAAVLNQLEGWFEHYNAIHPHKSLGYRSPREFRADMRRRE